MLKPVTSILAAVTLAGCSVFGVRDGYEQPAYSVVESLGEDLEVRAYAPRVAAEATVSTADTAEGRDQAFNLLFDYISGANGTESEIAMTTPVETASEPRTIAMTAPVQTARSADGGVGMRFFLPAQYSTETAPDPRDPRVRIVAVPAQTVAVLRFSGSRGEDAVRARTRDLERMLESTAWRAVGDPIAYFYNPPWTLPFFRRNEVAIPVTR